jgi:hypothetical protein
MTQDHCLNTVATAGTKVIVGTHCCNNGNRGHCWFLFTMTLDHIIAKVTLDNIVVSDTIVAFVILFEN